MIGKKLGHYEILRELGEGGMGAVYLAREVSLNRLVALKILPAELARDERFVRRFYREARAAAQINHPHVVTIHYVGESDGLHFLAMEHIEGPTLEKLIAEHGRIHPTTALEIAAHVAEGLGAAHEFGVIHRDIKPLNIMFDRAQRVRVLDFGLAKLMDDTSTRLTMAGGIFGTPEYMSPEQAEGAELDPRSDLYSLGVVLYHMLAGRTPFAGDTPIVILRNIVDKTIPPISQFNPELPPGVARLLEWMLAKHPEDRPASAQDLAAEIDSLLASGTLPAAPPKETTAKLARDRVMERIELDEQADREQGASDEATVRLDSSAGAEELAPVEPEPVTEPSPPPGRRSTSLWGMAGVVAALLFGAAAMGAVLKFVAPGGSETDRLTTVRDPEPETKIKARLRSGRGAKRVKREPEADTEEIAKEGAALPSVNIALAADAETKGGAKGDKREAARTTPAPTATSEPTATPPPTPAPNRAPVIRKVRFASSDIKTGEALVFKIEAGDPDDDAIVAYHYRLDGQSEERTSNGPAIEMSGLRAGERMLFVAAEDSRGARSKMAELRFRVIATPTPSPSPTPGPTPRLSPAQAHALANQQYEAKQYADALRLYREAAEAGVAAAMNDMGWMYRQGIGTAQDDGAAYLWYTRGARAGDPAATHNLGWMYDEGRGVDVDDERAVALYRRAAGAGEPAAMYSLGLMYETGEGVARSRSQVIEWMRKAAEAGYEPAESKLKRMGER